ncbi:hypothetical protein CYQ88_09975 [Hydrogenovibrio sp. SC-1]|uniref:Smr/MutS family protein n=1 Tax=Hydrogenovibrio sp. SC-1 TaxID=2065820 RepID=UPI000C7CC34B|nr:Smr/MutS family protein [Hydrogenovibrio sp. SC-1]PLA73641.1 hypothetical protein CYQ88_09975 [Hydrogenovibrio sp. SC-1]
MTKLTNEDKSLFADAVSDVTKLKTSHNKVAIASSKRAQKPGTSKRSLHFFQPDADDYLSTATNSEDEISTVDAHQKLSFKRPQLDTKSFKRLQKGLFQTIWHIDLHGLTEAIADQQLQCFMRDALAEKARYLIIIHGKGYNSNTHTPTLKNLINQRLRQFPKVLAFCSAQPKDGGTGAVYVFLQKEHS